MKIQKKFLPEASVLNRLSAISSVRLFVNCKNNPEYSCIYLIDEHGLAICFSWEYGDVEFKFEVYFLSIQIESAISVDELSLIKSIPSAFSMSFLVRSEWVRPTLENEVPANFEKVIEERGFIDSVPETATAVGVFLYGLILKQISSGEETAIIVDDDVNYSLKVVDDIEYIEKLKNGSDLFSLREVTAEAFLEKD